MEPGWSRGKDLASGNLASPTVTLATSLAGPRISGAKGLRFPQKYSLHLWALSDKGFSQGGARTQTRVQLLNPGVAGAGGALEADPPPTPVFPRLRGVCGAALPVFLG